MTRSLPGSLVVSSIFMLACSSDPAQPLGGTGSGGSGGSGQPAGMTGGSGGSGPAGSPTGGTGGSGGAAGAGGGAAGAPGPRTDAGSADRPAGASVGDAGGRDAAPRPLDASVAPDRGGASDAPIAVRAIPPTGGACPAGPFGDPLPANRTATLIRANAGSLEGPLWLADQNALLFCVVSGVPGMGRIDKYVPAANQITPFATGVDVAGLALGTRGAIVAASFDSRNLTQFDPVTAARTSLAGSNSFMNRPFNQTNDLVVRSDGNIYFTDTDYRQDGRPGQETTAFYRFSPAGAVTRLGVGPEPNGIALSPDGRLLYVSSTGGDPVRRFVLDEAGGVAGAPTVFTNASSDGMAVDCAGNVYLSTNGTIRVLSPAGQLLGSITGLGTSTVSNAAFGGPDRRTLFITTASALYRIDLNVPGFSS